MTNEPLHGGGAKTFFSGQVCTCDPSLQRIIKCHYGLEGRTSLQATAGVRHAETTTANLLGRARTKNEFSLLAKVKLILNLPGIVILGKTEDAL